MECVVEHGPPQRARLQEIAYGVVYCAHCFAKTRFRVLRTYAYSAGCRRRCLACPVSQVTDRGTPSVIEVLVKSVKRTLRILKTVELRDEELAD